MSAPSYRYEVARDYYNDDIGAYVTDPWPVIYPTRDEAEAAKLKLLAGMAPSFFAIGPESGFLEVFELIVHRDGSVSRTGA